MACCDPISQIAADPRQVTFCLAQLGISFCDPSGRQNNKSPSAILPSRSPQSCAQAPVVILRVAFAEYCLRRPSRASHGHCSSKKTETIYEKETGNSASKNITSRKRNTGGLRPNIPYPHSASQYSKKELEAGAPRFPPSKKAQSRMSPR